MDTQQLQLHTQEACDHESYWESHPPVPIQVQNGGLLVTAMYCTNCGHVEYRSPPLDRRDEDALQERMEEFARKKALTEPLPHRALQH